jgi:signal transduction histidine kinase
MNDKQSRLSGQYLRALRRHVTPGARDGLQAALRLGRKAVALDLETLDMVRIHEKALATLNPATDRDAFIKRAESFFSEAITPIEETHQAAIRTDARLNTLRKALHRRTSALADSGRSLKRGIIRRQAVEKALVKSGRHSRKLLEESRSLQRHLQRLTHQILAAQEGRRKKISRELHDEIAQTLLGIHVRLLNLKKKTGADARGLKKEIASTQGLVVKSVMSIKRFARELGIHHRT